MLLLGYRKIAYKILAIKTLATVLALHYQLYNISYTVFDTKALAIKLLAINYVTNSHLLHTPPGP